MQTQVTNINLNKSLLLSSNKDKLINLDIFIRICLNEYCERRILSMERLLAVLKIDRKQNNYSELKYSDYKDAVKSTWNEKSKKPSDSIIFSLNKIDSTYAHVIKELKDPLYNEDDVIIQLIPYLNGSKEVRSFTMRQRCKIMAKYLSENGVLEANMDSIGDDKNRNQYMSVKRSPKAAFPKSSIGKGQFKDAAPKSFINLPKSIVPIAKDLKDVTSNEILQAELQKQYEKSPIELKGLYTGTL